MSTNKPSAVSRRPGFEPYQDEHGRWHCGCEVRHGVNKGKPCTQPVSGPVTCKYHAPSPGRPITTGARSKYKLVRLAAKYEAARNDPELVSARDDIAVLEAFASDALAKADSSDGCPGCAAANEAFIRFLEAEDPKTRQKALSVLRAVLDKGSAGYYAKQEAFETMERKRRQQETEIKRLAALQQFVTMKELVVLMAQIAGAIRETVSSQTERARLVQKIDALIDAGE